MYYYCHQIAGLDTRYPDWLLARLNAAQVTGLALINFELLALTPTVGPMYQYRLRYVQDHPDYARWKDFVQVIREGVGDCKDLVAWRVAELWHQGIDAHVVSSIQRQDNGDILYHVQIQLPDGTIEDPSVKLGMR